MKRELKAITLFLFTAQAVSCNQGINNESRVTDPTASSSESSIYPESENGSVATSKGNFDLNHKYSYVKELEDGSYIFGLLELYGENDFTQAVTMNGFAQSGRGIFSVNGNVMSLNKTNGIAIDGNLKISNGEDGKIWLTLDNGVTYVQDDKGYYIKNVRVTPATKEASSYKSNENSENEDTNEDAGFLTFEGTMNDEQSGITQDYKLLIKSDWSHASIGGGPFFRIEDQGNGAYMWIDGSIIGMSFKYLNDKCIIYGSEGDYFCTLYKR